jgi:hypothetical protein
VSYVRALRLGESSLPPPTFYFIVLKNTQETVIIILYVSGTKHKKVLDRYKHTKLRFVRGGMAIRYESTCSLFVFFKTLVVLAHLKSLLLVSCGVVTLF